MNKSFIRWHVVETQDVTEIRAQASFSAINENKSLLGRHSTRQKAWQALFKGCIQPGDLIIDRGMFFLYLTQYVNSNN